MMSNCCTLLSALVGADAATERVTVGLSITLLCSADVIDTAAVSISVSRPV